jgi:uncharacterized protein (DUF302 family)
MLYERETTGSIDEVTKRVEEATQQHNFGVMGTHDLKERMAAKGVEFGPECRVVEVCNPRQAKAVLESNMAISTAMPCRISIYEQGGKVKVSMLRPAALLNMFGSSELESAANEVEATMTRIIDDACK